MRRASRFRRCLHRRTCLRRRHAVRLARVPSPLSRHLHGRVESSPLGSTAPLRSLCSRHTRVHRPCCGRGRERLPLPTSTLCLMPSRADANADATLAGTRGLLPTSRCAARTLTRDSLAPPVDAVGRSAAPPRTAGRLGDGYCVSIMVCSSHAQVAALKECMNSTNQPWSTAMHAAQPQVRAQAMSLACPRLFCALKPN
jgi:hypothetical protein